MDGNSGENLLTTNQVAKLLGVTPQTIARWVDEGHLVCCYRSPHGHRRFRQEDIDAFLTAHSGTAVTPG